MACQSAKDEAEAPNVELVAGDFYSESWGGAQVDRFHVVARRREDDDAVIWSPDHPKTCSLGPVAWYDANQPLREGGLAWGALGKAIVPFIDVLDDQGRGTLSFSGADCKPLGLQVEDVDPADLWTAYDSSYLAPTYLARTRDQRLLLGDLGKMQAREIAHDVGAVNLLDEGMWLIEGGQAVLRDAKGKELARTGHDVRELIPLAQDELVYTGEGGLFHYLADKPLKRFASAACNVTVLSGFSDFTLAYFSPCDTRTLVIDDGKHPRWSVQDGVADLISTGGSLLYAVMGDSGQSSVWLASASSFDSTKRQAHNLGAVGTGPIQLDALLKRTSAKLLLMARAPVTGAAPATGVEPQNATALVLFEVDTDKLRIAPLVLGGASSGATSDGPQLVMARSFSHDLLTLDDAGTLELRRLSNLGLTYRVTNVSRSSVRTLFGESLPALGYLRNIDPATSAGDLEIYFVERGERRKVASHVRELHQVWWPETGVLYSTAASAPGGAALWFAHVTVPCSQTTGAPWTCL